MYAVIKSGGKQHRVEEGEQLKLEKQRSAQLQETVDNLGADEVVRRLEAIKASDEIQRRPGGIEKFTPAPILKTKVQKGGTLRD